jgi:hypothetical protein
MKKSRQSETRVLVGARLPVSLRDQLRRIACERDTSVSHLVTKAVAHYLSHVLVPIEQQDQMHTSTEELKRMQRGDNR